MPDTTRTFVAVPIPADRAAKLERLQTLIAPEMPGARWVAPKHFHITLAFLGDVENTDLARVCNAVRESAAGFDPFYLSLEGLGVFPNAERPRVAWVGFGEEGSIALKGLQRAVASALAQVGHPPEDDRFHPHVTLGRLKPGRGPGPNIEPLLAHYRRWMGGSFEAIEVVTFASTVTPDGPEYVALDKAPLGRA